MNEKEKSYQNKLREKRIFNDKLLLSSLFSINILSSFFAIFSFVLALLTSFFPLLIIGWMFIFIQFVALAYQIRIKTRIENFEEEENG